MDQPIVVWNWRRNRHGIVFRKMSSRRLLIATRNRGKLQEIKVLLEGLPLELCDLNSFPVIGSIAETGNTFAENASLKATGYAAQAVVMTLADDSGLEVEALYGAPGVLSARYAGEGASDSQRVDKLLSELEKIDAGNRAARFISVVAISDSSGTILNVSSGVCNGAIAAAPRGTNGFGYDPIFVPTGFDKTFAELTPLEKNQISHRALALRGATEFLRSLTVRQPAR
jgi:XTP/dITP diphosphohydrolase